MTSGLIQTFIDTLKPSLEQHEFKLQKAKRRFARKADDCHQWYTLDFTNYESLHVKPGIAIRFDQVESIFHRTSGYESRFQLDTPTLSFSIQNVFGGLSNFEYAIRDTDDFERTALQLLHDFIEVAIPFFNKNSTLACIDTLLNESPESDCIYYCMENLRCSHGLIVAKLIGNSNFDNLVKVYRAKVAQISNGFYAPEFERLVRDLESGSF